jgi:hypothetical protein
MLHLLLSPHVSNDGPFSAGAIALADWTGSFSTDSSLGTLFTTSFRMTEVGISSSLTEISGKPTYIPVIKTVQTVLPTVVPVSSPSAKR